MLAGPWPAVGPLSPKIGPASISMSSTSGGETEVLIEILLRAFGLSTPPVSDFLKRIENGNLVPLLTEVLSKPGRLVPFAGIVIAVDKRVQCHLQHQLCPLTEGFEVLR